MTLSPTDESVSPATGPGRSPSRRERNLTGGRRTFAGAIVLAAAVVLPFVVPGITGLLVVAAIFFLVALGLTLLMGHAGQVSLGQTLFMAIGGYGAGALTLSWHW